MQTFFPFFLSRNQVNRVCFCLFAWSFSMVTQLEEMILLIYLLLMNFMSIFNFVKVHFFLSILLLSGL